VPGSYGLLTFACILPFMFAKPAMEYLTISLQAPHRQRSLGLKLFKASGLLKATEA
jgi:hypothetical protein